MFICTAEYHIEWYNDTCQMLLSSNLSDALENIKWRPSNETMSSWLCSMAAQSRRASRSSLKAQPKDCDSEPSPNEYELERDRRKKALHDRVQLTLIQSGFGEAAKLRSVFSGERTSETITPASSRPRRRRVKVATTLPQERRRSARNFGKTAAAVISTSASKGDVKKVRFLRSFAMCMHEVLRELGYSCLGYACSLQYSSSFRFSF